MNSLLILLPGLVRYCLASIFKPKSQGKFLSVFPSLLVDLIPTETKLTEVLTDPI